MTKERDPLHWETLIDLQASELKAALAECAQNHLGWAVDQACTLYDRTKLGSDQARVISEFALENAALVAAEDASAGLQAWHLAAADKSADPEKTAEAFGQLLDQISKSDMHRAWDLATVALATAETYNPIRGRIVSFIAEHGSDPEGLLPLSLSREFAVMADFDLARVVAHMETLSGTQPYRAVQVLRAIVEANSGRPPESAVQRAYALLGHLKEDPGFMAQLLQEEQGVTVVLNPGQPCHQTSSHDGHGPHPTLQ